MAIRKSSISGVPKGNTAARPSSPSIGDVFYNGQLEILEIYNGTSWVAVSAPPATPSITSVTNVGTGVAYATGGTFTVVMAPGSGGGTPSQYNVYTTSGGFSASSSSTTISLTGLTPGTSFTVYGNVQNNFGSTVNTANAAAVTATTVPQAPTIGTLSDGGNDGELSLTFTAGATGGQSITNYQYSIDNGSTYTAFNPVQTTSPLTISGLTNGTSYTVRLKAVNANGVSTQSSASNSAIPTIGTISVNYVLVGGGAGGGGPHGTGGGAGGYLTSTVTNNKSTNYSITIGNGGTGVAGNSVQGGDGGSTTAFSLTAGGGGGGGRGYDATGSNANGRAGVATNGSGGGGGGGGGTGGAGNGAGYAGGNGSATSPGAGGGGGGAGAVGNNGTGGGTGSTGGNGGNGVATSISGSSVTYGGGGGGGGWTTTGAPGGSGGGGKGGNPAQAGTAGTANTGGGGGGGGDGGGSGANGGSGIAIFRYLTSAGTITIGAGLTGSTATDGAYKVTTITAGIGNVSWA